MTGALVAVVGPSGAGKDAVIAHACAHYGEEDCVIFPRRIITRPAGAGENHIPVAEEEFASLERSGAFAVQWDAHGLRYGIPCEVADAVAAGHVAVINVSRAALAKTTIVFPCVRAVRVTVPDDIRRERILARGRESAAEVHARLHRPDPVPHQQVDLEIVNDGPVAHAGRSLVTFVQTVLASIDGQSSTQAERRSRSARARAL